MFEHNPNEELDVGVVWAKSKLLSLIIYRNDIIPM